MGPPVSPEGPVRVHALHPGITQGRHPWPGSPTWEAHVHTAYPHSVTCVCGQVHGKGVCTRPPVGTPHPELRTARWTCPLQRHTGVCGDRREAEGGHTWARILAGGERRRNPRGRPPRRGGVAKTEHGLCHFMGRPDPGTRTGWDTHVVGGRASTFGGCSRPGCEDTGDTHGPVLRGRAPGRCPHPVSSQLTSARLSCCCGCPRPKSTPEFPPIPSPGSRSSRGPGLGCTFPGGLGHFLLPCRHHSLMWVWSGQGPPARQCLGRAPASAIRNQRVPCWPWGQSCRN